MTDNRTRHIGVMVTEALYSKLEARARRRKGIPSVSSTVNDILISFFDDDASEMTQNDTSIEASGAQPVYPIEVVS